MALKIQSGADHDGADAPIMAEINITPLTDIFLVLLIIFMVTSSVMSQVGVDVQLPKASAASSQSQPDGVIVTLLSGGGIKINEVAVPGFTAGDFAPFEGLVREALGKSKSKLVILEGDHKAFLGSAIQIMDHARKAGAASFAIATQPE